MEAEAWESVDSSPGVGDGEGDVEAAAWESVDSSPGVGDGEGDVETAAWAALVASWAMRPTESQRGFLNSTSSSCNAQQQDVWISQHWAGHCKHSWKELWLANYPTELLIKAALGGCCQKVLL